MAVDGPTGGKWNWFKMILTIGKQASEEEVKQNTHLKPPG